MTEVHRAWFLEKFDERRDAGEAKNLVLLGGSVTIKALKIETPYVRFRSSHPTLAQVWWTIWI